MFAPRQRASPPASSCRVARPGATDRRRRLDAARASSAGCSGPSAPTCRRPRPSSKPPVMWGDEDHVRALFAAQRRRARVRAPHGHLRGTTRPRAGSSTTSACSARRSWPRPRSSRRAATTSCAGALALYTRRQRGRRRQLPRRREYLLTSRSCPAEVQTARRRRAGSRVSAERLASSALRAPRPRRRAGAPRRVVERRRPLREDRDRAAGRAA